MDRIDGRCILCESDQTSILYPSTIKEGDPAQFEAYRCTSIGYGVHNAIVQCAQCGLIFASPRRAQNDILAQYKAVEDPLYIDERKGRILTFQHHLKPIKRLIGSPHGKRLLDVGAYSGVFVEIALKNGWDAIGIEPSQWAVDQARLSGIPMIEGTLLTAQIDPASVDVITFWDVIEHLDNPLTELAAAFRSLKPGGWIVIHTMDIDSFFARIMGRHWPWFMEMHVYYFSRRTLRDLIEKAGFQWKECGAQGRYLRLGYLFSRLEPYIGSLALMLMRVTEVLHINKLPVPINLGDLITAYAVKPKDEV